MTRCWVHESEEIERRYGWASPEMIDYWQRESKGVCMLPDGHDGPHAWTPEDQIVITFKGERKDGEG